jgi:hypothetical protein
MVKSKEIIRRLLNDRAVRVLFGSVILVLAIVAISALFTASAPGQAKTPGQVLQFNGQTLSLDGAAQVKVQSSNSVTAYGDVTMTVNTVTVTVWMREPGR